VAVRHRDAAERTVLTATAGGASPAALADLLFAAETDRAYADGGHSLDFINKAFECLDLIGWEHAADVLPSVVGQMAAARGAEERTAWRHDRARLDSTNETTGTFGRNAAQISVHVLSPRDPKTSSVEQNLDGEPSWDGRESAGPDGRGHNSARSPREWSN
jgi:hypothetical protein